MDDIVALKGEEAEDSRATVRCALSVSSAISPLMDGAQANVRGPVFT